MHVASADEDIVSQEGEQPGKKYRFKGPIACRLRQHKAEADANKAEEKQRRARFHRNSPHHTQLLILACTKC